MSAPSISVVLAVRDGAPALESTIDSVLSQRDAELELIVVDDGSVDASREIARAYAARDARVRPIERVARGLTAALVDGCAAARGELIARQDCGDRSLPGRLAKLAAAITGASDRVLAAGGTRFLGPAGEPLFERVQTTEELRRGLSARRPRELVGPSHHGCALFRRAAYDSAGGYRAAFRVAQDIDLWLRLAELGEVMAVPEVLYEASWSPGSISALWRDRQVAAAGIAWQAAQRRRAGESDDAELARAEEVTGRVRGSLWRRTAAADYFVGSCLRASDPRASRAYFARALVRNPLHLKALIRWLTTAR